MTPKKQPLQVPFLKDGSVPHYDGYRDSKLKDNIIFLATLHYAGYSRGRSSALILMEDSMGKKYNLFMSTFDDLMRMPTRHQYSFTHGAVFTGRWTYCKKGSNYALRPLTDKETIEYDDYITATNQAKFAKDKASSKPSIEPWNLRTGEDKQVDQES